MKISKPIVNFDLETTGTDTQEDRIVQMAATKLNNDGSRVSMNIMLNPEMPIPPGATATHGITDEDVKDCPTFKEAAPELILWLSGCDFMGFNLDAFDIPLLVAEFKRAEINFPEWEFNSVDVSKLYRKLNPRTLADLYFNFTGRKLEGAHEAGADVHATEVVLSYLLEQHFKAETTPKELDEFCQGDKKRVDLSGKLYLNDQGVMCWAFGKNIDKPVLDDPSYISWVLGKDFPFDTKEALRKLLAT